MKNFHFLVTYPPLRSNVGQVSPIGFDISRHLLASPCCITMQNLQGGERWPSPSNPIHHVYYLRHDHKPQTHRIYQSTQPWARGWGQSIRHADPIWRRLPKQRAASEVGWLHFIFNPLGPRAFSHQAFRADIYILPTVDNYQYICSGGLRSKW